MTKLKPFPLNGVTLNSWNDYSCCRNHGVDICIVFGEPWTWLSDEDKNILIIILIIIC